ncbi:MAG: hypothetical protein ACR2GW_07130 [Pyrinomonadaceae bacterium]
MMPKGVEHFNWQGKKLKTFADVQAAIKTVNNMGEVAVLSAIICSMNTDGFITTIEVLTAGAEMEPQIRRIMAVTGDDAA